VGILIDVGLTGARPAKFPLLKGTEVIYTFR